LSLRAEVADDIAARIALHAHCARVLNSLWDGPSTNKIGRARRARGLRPADVRRISWAVQHTRKWLGDFPMATHEHIAQQKRFLDEAVEMRAAGAGCVISPLGPREHPC